MFMALSLDHDLSLTCPLCDDSCLILGRRVFGFFVAEMARNSFPNFLEVHSHRS
jgi:hypothetical protein